MAELKNILVPLEHTDDLVAVAAGHLGVSPDQIETVRVLRRAIDARGKRPRWVVNLAVKLAGEPESPGDVWEMVPPQVANSGKRCVIVGAGPAGLFAALRFADAGVPCVLIERGARMDGRHRRARKLRAERTLDTETNLCFGEGGAGTYSDGKLYTRKKNAGVRAVYQRLVDMGADADILVDAHPHIGTNRLIKVISRLTEHLANHGIELRFDTRVDDLIVADGSVKAVVCGNEQFDADAVILATGHSARDTYAMLGQRGVAMEPKPFAVGARVEHPQALIDTIQFGQSAGHPALGSAEYFLKCQRGERGIYSFCMCPGGFIIPTPTETGHLNVNGMSNESRRNRFGNAALVVTVTPQDFAPDGNALMGLEFQRQIERATFELGGGDYTAPAARLTDYCAGRGSTTLPALTSYRPSLNPADITRVLPAYINHAIAEAVQVFNRRLKGYLTEEAVIVASETTTSSPIRISRDESLQSVSIKGLYPTGEGAGYAGGIVSSAIDGMRVAEQVLAVS